MAELQEGRMADGRNCPDASVLAVRRLREKLQRIDQLSVREDFVVDVCAGRSPGRSDVADDVAALDALARLRRKAAHVSVARRQPEAVTEDDQVPVIAGV